MRAFSARTAWDLEEGALARAIREARRQGRALVDLTVSNPTVCGFDYEIGELLDALRSAASMVYDPDARGILTARAAVSRYYAERHASVDPDQLLLTTSTSEAYSFLFRLLCDPGDVVLVAEPSYPLFNFLADLEDVRLESFPLFYDFGWWIDFAELERRITPRTRAVVLVHPNNPTGQATGPAERERMQELCARYGLALIVDEVFLDYGREGEIVSFATGPHPGLTFVISGLSKVAALPQMKVGWLACFGPPAARREALARLEVIADTFLSLNAPAQHALPRWLATGPAIRAQIIERVKSNVARIERRGAFQMLRSEAGWSAVLRLPAHFSEREPALELVHHAGVVTHPGAFYGLPGDRHVVISTLGPVEITEKGLQKLNCWCESLKLTAD